MIGYCSRCRNFGEVDLVPVANGGQRLLCPGCAAEPLFPAGAHTRRELAETMADRVTVGRVTTLWIKLRRGAITVPERAELETALTILYHMAIDEHDAAHVEAAAVALGYVRMHP